MAILNTNTGRMRVEDNGNVKWVLDSGREVRSGIQIPPADEVYNAEGTAEALRVLADYVVTRAMFGERTK